ncbi:MAG TPA: hypothetical protein VKV17_02905 [Bryobacteraceae bacterium]|nr:hypothetical protein [Bryobacteraceae bacterium]
MTQADIDQAIRNQIGIDPEAPLPNNPEIAQALANSATGAAAAAANLNSNLTQIYLTGFQNWAQQVLAGKIPNTNPPQPPAAYLAVQASDGWTYVIRGTDPVCAMPPIPSIPQPAGGMVVAIGSRIANTNFWAALPANANVPNGYTTPQPAAAADGTVGFFSFLASPFGGWWERVG